MPRPSGPVKFWSSLRRTEPSSGHPKPRSASPKWISGSSGSASVISQVPAPAGLNHFTAGTWLPSGLRPFVSSCSRISGVTRSMVDSRRFEGVGGAIRRRPCGRGPETAQLVLRGGVRIGAGASLGRRLQGSADRVWPLPCPGSCVGHRRMSAAGRQKTFPAGIREGLGGDLQRKADGFTQPVVTDVREDCEVSDRRNSNEPIRPAMTRNRVQESRRWVSLPGLAQRSSCHVVHVRPACAWFRTFRWMLEGVLRNYPVGLRNIPMEIFS